VLKRREAAKRRHESGVDADTRRRPSESKVNDLSTLTAAAAAAREVCVCVCVCVRERERERERRLRPAASLLPTSGTSEYGQVHRPQHTCHL